MDGYSQQSVNPGKRLLLRVATVQSVTLVPVTQEADIAKAVIEDKVYFVMDTPGFDAENENTYFEIMRGIESIRHFARIAGVLYLTCINQLHFEDFDRKLVRFIYAFSGEGFIPRVTFVTTFWTVAGNQQREIFNRQLGLLQREWEQGVHSQHLSLYQHGREYNAHGQGTGHIINWFENRNQIAQHAKEMIDRNYGPATSEYHPPKIVRELDANIPISETEAAQVLGMSSASTNESTSHRQSREQPGQQRQTPTPPGASGNSQPGSEVPQDPPASGFSAFLDGFFRFVGNTLGNTTWEVNFGGPGPGPASSMRTELFGWSLQATVKICLLMPY